MIFFIKKDRFRVLIVNAFVVICCLFIVYAYGCSSVKVSSIPQHDKGLYESKKYPSTGISSKPYKIAGKWYTPIREAKGFKQKGVASWYGKKFHGKRTSNGEIYDMYKISAAHKTLPLGTWVRVHNLENNKKIEARINDRGPFVEGRIIDLSYAAARYIGMMEAGTAKVHIAVLVSDDEKTDGKENINILSSCSADDYTGYFSIQVGAFSDSTQAEIMKSRLDMSYENAFITVFEQGSNKFYRVRVGIYPTLEQAQRFESILRRHGYHNVFTVVN